MLIAVKTTISLVAVVLACGLTARPSLAFEREAAAVGMATEVLESLSGIPTGIPPALLREAQGVAIIPNVIKAGFVFGGRFGRGVILVRCPDGSWTAPVFVTLAGGSFGWQLGVQSTDLVLVFKTKNGLNRILEGKGKLTLGADVSVAAGPVGRQAEAATDAQLRAEILSYSRTRGLFAGVSLEGAAILIDNEWNASFYGIPGVRVADIMGGKVAEPAVADKLRGVLGRLSAPAPVVPQWVPGMPVQPVPPGAVPQPVPVPLPGQPVAPAPRIEPVPVPPKN